MQRAYVLGSTYGSCHGSIDSKLTFFLNNFVLVIILSSSSGMYDYLKD